MIQRSAAAAPICSHTPAIAAGQAGNRAAHMVFETARHLYHAYLSNLTIDEVALDPYRTSASRPDGRRCHGGGKAGLHGDTVPDNVRRGQPQGKRHRKQTAAR